MTILVIPGEVLRYLTWRKTSGRRVPSCQSTLMAAQGWQRWMESSLLLEAMGRTAFRLLSSGWTKVQLPGKWNKECSRNPEEFSLLPGFHSTSLNVKHLNKKTNLKKKLLHPAVIRKCILSPLISAERQNNSGSSNASKQDNWVHRGDISFD